MNRRNFLGSVAGITGYSLAIKAPQSLSANPDALPETDLEIANRIKDLGVSTTDATIALEPNMQVVELEADLLVAGGGMAGISAAIAAARGGSKVVLIQDRSRLGGNASSEIKMHPLGMGSYHRLRDCGIIEEICLENAYQNEQNVWEIWDFILYDKVIREPNIRLLLDTTVFKAEVEGRTITQVMTRCDRTETLYKIKSQYYLDSTGDSRLGLEAGAEMMVGREGSAKYGEDLADYDELGTTQGSSILFTSREHSRPMAFEPPSWSRLITADDLKHRRLGPETWNYGYWWIELGGVYDTIKDNERLRFELLAIVMGTWDYIKNSGQFPEAANWALDSIGMIPGKRDSRRIQGDFLFTQHHVQGKWEEMPDGVATGGWSLDDHPAKGFNAPDRRPAQQIRVEVPYNIPFGSMIAKDFDNLFMAGRNISASHVAFTSTRVMKTCAVIGQAVGTAVNICRQQSISPRELRNQKIGTLQQELLKQGQLIFNIKNEDPLDHARRASIKATGTVQDSKPEAVIDGITHDKRDELIHRWVANTAGEGASLELSWDKPVKVSKVMLYHDTGLSRLLTMSPNKRVISRTIYGPQPETCRNYRILGIRADGSEVELTSIFNNYQRLRQHSFDSVEIKALKVRFEASNSEDGTFGLYEIRAYS